MPCERSAGSMYLVAVAFEREPFRAKAFALEH